MQRTNVLTLVQKAAKRYERPELLNEYDVLCDAVHPSWGSLECFWIEAGRAAELAQSRILLGTDAVGWLAADDKTIRPGSPLAATVLTCSSWALKRLATDLPTFDRTCRDLCLTARVYLLSNLDYWGIVRPTRTYEMCPCRSGRKTKFCTHEFGPA